MATRRPTPELLTATECARRLRVHPSTITRWVRQGVLPAWRIAGTVRIRWTDVLRVAHDTTPDQARPP